MLRLLAFCLFAVLLCSAVGRSDALSVWEGSSMALNCDTNFIRIKSAGYGRFDRNCFAGRSMEVAMYECNGQNRCTLYAENSAFGEPCRKVTKQLKVLFSCVETPPSQGFLVRACEDHPLKISCPAKKIDIISANYGRATGGHICNRGSIKSTNCGAKDAIDKVRTSCQGKQECSLHASNSVFGEPCRGTNKYLEVRYECE